MRHPAGMILQMSLLIFFSAAQVALNLFINNVRIVRIRTGAGDWRSAW